jgi:hypothetical protein
LLLYPNFLVEPREMTRQHTHRFGARISTWMNCLLDEPDEQIDQRSRRRDRREAVVIARSSPTSRAEHHFWPHE